MIKNVLAAGVALAMMTGVVLAQSVSSDTSTSTKSTATDDSPAGATYASGQSKKTIDSDGMRIDKSQSTTRQNERTASPSSDTTTTHHESTTTIKP